MLSTVERGQRVPSILVMARIATALDTSIGRLVGEEATPRVIVMRGADQRVVKDPVGIERRSLSPVLPGIEFELIRMTLAPGIDAGTFPPHRAESREYLAVETGTLTLTLAKGFRRTDRTAHIIAVDPALDRARQLVLRSDIQLCASIEAVGEFSPDIIVLAVKPQQIPASAPQIAGVAGSNRSTIVPIAAAPRPSSGLSLPSMRAAR